MVSTAPYHEIPVFIFDLTPEVDLIRLLSLKIANISRCVSIGTLKCLVAHLTAIIGLGDNLVSGRGPLPSPVTDPGYMSRKIRNFRTDKFDT